MCFGGGATPEDPKPVPSYTPVKDATPAQDAARGDNSGGSDSNRAALYRYNNTNKTSGLGVQGNAFTSQPQATITGG